MQILDLSLARIQFPLNTYTVFIEKIVQRVQRKCRPTKNRRMLAIALNEHFTFGLAFIAHSLQISTVLQTAMPRPTETKHYEMSLSSGRFWHQIN